MNMNKHQKHMTGFSLVELMVVVFIIGLLVSIAYPSYVNQVTGAKRSDGQIGLMNASQSLERCFTEYNAYNHANCGFAATSPEGHYAIATVSAATTFTLTATPQATQVDPLCENLTLTSAGVQGETGAGTVDDCW